MGGNLRLWWDPSLSPPDNTSKKKKKGGGVEHWEHYPKVVGSNTTKAKIFSISFFASEHCNAPIFKQKRHFPSLWCTRLLGFLHTPHHTHCSAYSRMQPLGKDSHNLTRLYNFPPLTGLTEQCCASEACKTTTESTVPAAYDSPWNEYTAG